MAFKNGGRTVSLSGTNELGAIVEESGNAKND